MHKSAHVSAAIIVGRESVREQNLAGSEWVLLSGKTLRTQNWVLSETASAGAIILSLLNLSLSVCVPLYMCAYMCVHACVCVCVCASFPCLESPQSLRELWKINTLRQLCLFIHLITHYHCITVPLISHHRAQIDTFVLFYHTGVWCNQLNLHLMADTCIKWTLSMNTGRINNTAIWKRGVKVCGPACETADLS